MACFKLEHVRLEELMKKDETNRAENREAVKKQANDLILSAQGCADHKDCALAIDFRNCECESAESYRADDSCKRNGKVLNIVENEEFIGFM